MRTLYTKHTTSSTYIEDVSGKYHCCLYINILSRLVCGMSKFVKYNNRPHHTDVLFGKYSRSHIHFTVQLNWLLFIYYINMTV